MSDSLDGLQCAPDFPGDFRAMGPEESRSLKVHPCHDPSGGQISLHGGLGIIGGVEESLARGGNQKRTESGKSGCFGKEAKVVFPCLSKTDARVEQNSVRGDPLRLERGQSTSKESFDGGHDIIVIGLVLHCFGGSLPVHENGHDVRKFLKNGDKSWINESVNVVDK